MPAGEAKAAQQNVRNVGSRTFFRRDGQWVDSQVTKTQEAKAQRIKSVAVSVLNAFVDFFQTESADPADRIGKVSVYDLAADAYSLKILRRLV